MAKGKPAWTALDKKLMKLWGSIGREDARCEICDLLPIEKRYNYSVVHAHHIIGRGHRATNIGFGCVQHIIELVHSSIVWSLILEGGF